MQAQGGYGPVSGQQQSQAPGPYDRPGQPGPGQQQQAQGGPPPGQPMGKGGPMQAPQQAMGGPPGQPMGGGKGFAKGGYGPPGGGDGKGYGPPGDGKGYGPPGDGGKGFAKGGPPGWGPPQGGKGFAKGGPPGWGPPGPGMGPPGGKGWGPPGGGKGWGPPPGPGMGGPPGGKGWGPPPGPGMEGGKGDGKGGWGAPPPAIAQVEEPVRREWGEEHVRVIHGQLNIELSMQDPPLDDDALMNFCDWLDGYLPQVVANYPHLRKTGANVDLSDNVIGPQGLDRLFEELRKHQVPCVTMKCFRNVVNDAVIDTFVEYLHTQPENLPITGIHISHNRISDKGALRFLRASCTCGHYPTKVTKKPLWLRLENNEIDKPEEVIAQCGHEEYAVCTMKDGLCTQLDCDHVNVTVQVPHFYSQNNNQEKKPKGDKGKGKGKGDFGDGKGKGKGEGKGGKKGKKGVNRNVAKTIDLEEPEPALEDYPMEEHCPFKLDWSGRDSNKHALPMLIDIKEDSVVAKASIKPGENFLVNLNGMDVSMLEREQVEDALEERPVRMKVGKLASDNFN